MTYNMKKVIAYILKEAGIHKLIAFKSMYHWKSDGAFLLYANIRMALHYKYSKEEILHQLNWELSMWKDFAQYQ